jgi:Leucine-rich repeat (LRR) protein
MSIGPGLSSLTRLDVCKNDLGGSIPADIGELVHLKYFYGYQNRFTGKLPASMSKLTKLEYLSLRSNELEGSIEVLSSCTQLVNVELQVLCYTQAIHRLYTRYAQCAMHNALCTMRYT